MNGRLEHKLQTNQKNRRNATRTARCYKAVS